MIPSGIDNHNLAVFIHRLHSDYISGLLGDLVALHTFAAAVLAGEFFHIVRLPIPFSGYDQEIFALAADLHTDDNVAVTQVHAAYAHGHSSCCTYIGLTEPDALSIFCYQKDILVIVCYFYFDQAVVLSQRDRSKSGLADSCIFGDDVFLTRPFSVAMKRYLPSS